ncbi:MAG: thiamine pyrophosphate-binding protein [Tranquillimonas sp.]
MRGADLLVQTLAAAGVSRIFSLSGNQIMPIYDACLEAGMPIIHVRHEAAALYMAEAHAQLTGEVGVALVTAGAGAANALAPLLTAAQSETPVLLLSGDSPLAQDGTGAFQEMDQVGMTAPLTKLSLRARDAAGLGEDIARALRVAASGRPGPVHVALPFDVVQQAAEGAAGPGPDAFAPAGIDLDPAAVAQILGAVARADRPVVLCGPLLNPTRGGSVTSDLAGALDLPVVAMESPRGLNDPSLGAVRQVLARADLIVSLGKRIDFTLGFGSGAAAETTAWISVQPDTAEQDRARRNLGDRLVQTHKADPRAAARALTRAGGGGTARSDWRRQAAEMIARRPAAADPGEVGDGSISPAQICGAVARLLERSDGSVLIGDGGEFGQWAQALLPARPRVINGVSGAIGGGLGYGIAAALARPDATVVVMTGDGSLGFHLAEFETAVRAGARLVVVVGNDRRWNAEHQIQLRDYGAERVIGCDLSGARYDLAAWALGGHGEFVTAAGELDAALARAVASGRAACINVAMQGQPAPAAPAH